MSKEYYAKMVAEHRCINCSNPLPDGYTLRRCPKCQAKNKEYRQGYYKGKCFDCRCDLPPNYKYRTCKSCRVKRSQEYYAKKESRNDRT